MPKFVILMKIGVNHQNILNMPLIDPNTIKYSYLTLKTMFSLTYNFKIGIGSLKGAFKPKFDIF